jgi:Spy/CpxP family protein refolding chaperone
MTIRRSTLTLTALLALLLLPFAAEAAGRQPRDPGAILRNPRALAAYLRLTPQQVTTAQRLAAELKAAETPLLQAEKPLAEAYRNLIEAASPNPCDVGQAALALRANREKIRAARENFDTQFSAILTPEQLARYEALKAAAHFLQGDDDQGA